MSRTQKSFPSPPKKKKPWSKPSIQALGNLRDLVRQGQGKSGFTMDGESSNFMN